MAPQFILMYGFAHAVFMNVLRYDFFSYSSLPENKDSGIHSGNLSCNVKDGRKLLTVAYNVFIRRFFH